jgi:hypothetical protein
LHRRGPSPPHDRLPFRPAVGALLRCDTGLLVNLAEWLLAAPLLGLGLRNGADGLSLADRALFGSALRRLLRCGAGFLAACLFLGPLLSLFARNRRDLLGRTAWVVFGSSLKRRGACLIIRLPLNLCLLFGPPSRLSLCFHASLLAARFLGDLPARLRLCNGTDLLRGTACLLVGASLLLRCQARLLATCRLGGLALGLRFRSGTVLLR